MDDLLSVCRHSADALSAYQFRYLWFPCFCAWVLCTELENPECRLSVIRSIILMLSKLTSLWFAWNLWHIYLFFWILWSPILLYYILCYVVLCSKVLSTFLKKFLCLFIYLEAENHFLQEHRFLDRLNICCCAEVY